MKTYNFLSKNITIEKKEYEGREFVTLKYTQDEKFIYLNSKLFERIAGATIQIDGTVIEPFEGSIYRAFWKRIARIKFIEEKTDELLSSLEV